MTTITPIGPDTESIAVQHAPAPAPRPVSLVDRIRMRAGLALLVAGNERAARAAHRTVGRPRAGSVGRPRIEVARPFC